MARQPAGGTAGVHMSPVVDTRKLQLPFDVQLGLLDPVVTPVVQYGCKNCCYEGCLRVLEQLHLQFFEIIVC